MDCFRINLNAVRNTCTFYLKILKNNSNTCLNKIKPSRKVFRFNKFRNKFKLIFCFNISKSSRKDIEMTLNSNDLFNIKENYPDLEVEIHSILISRANDGASIEEIRHDYFNYTGLQFPHVECPTDLLLSIPFVCCKNTNGTRIFNVLPTEKTNHIFNMVLKQKPDQNNRCANLNPPTNLPNRYTNNIKVQNNNPNNKTNIYKRFGESDNGSIKSGYSKVDSDGYRESNCFYEDNYKYLLGRYQQSQFSTNKRSINSHYLSAPSLSSYSASPTRTKHSQQNDDSFCPNFQYNAHLCDFQLMGDDFFLYMARMELKCKFTPNKRILQSGLCISGLTIRDAIDEIRRAKYISKGVIINLGSVDIMQGSSLIQIEHDYLRLLEVLKMRNVTPILTTIAPLANLTHLPATRSIWERFNKFIRQKSIYYSVLDVWSCMVNEHGKILFDCYQNEPRKVTGSKLPHVFWNNIGRQRVLKLIEAELEY